MVAVNQGPHSLDRHLRPLMDKFPNLYAETSYMLGAGMIEGLCDRHGPERFLFGTAFPDNCSGGSLLRLAQADIGEEARAKIAAGNLTRLIAWGEGTAVDPCPAARGRGGAGQPVGDCRRVPACRP